MKIDISNGQFFYDLFYQISFLLVLIIYLIEGYKRKFPSSTWLLVIVTVYLFFIIGSKFGAITPEDFRYFTKNFQFPASYNKNVIGALFFGFIGIGFAKMLLRIRYPVLDAFAIAMPFGLAVQRIGCLMVGCCYGNETHLPWAIQYGVHSPAFLSQYFSHQQGLHDQLSLSIHPVPLYFIISSLLIGVTLIVFRHRWKRPGNLALFGFLLLFACRFVIEFFRDPHSNGSFQGNYFLGLKIVQIICIIVVIALLVVIRIREKQAVAKSYPAEPNHPLHNSLYLLILSALLYVTRSWFSEVEFQVLLITLVPAVLSVTGQLITSYYSTSVRLSTAALMLLSLILMSQKNPHTEDKSYRSIRVGYSNGNYKTYHDMGYGSGCDRVSYNQEFKQNYNLGGVGYSIIKIDSTKVLEYGLNAYVGSQTEKSLTTGVSHVNSINGINPFTNVDIKWVGGGLGFHLGSLRLTPFSWYQDVPNPIMPETGTINTFLYPQVYLRIGPEKIIYVSYHLGDQFPAPFPTFYNYVEIGSRLGLNNGFRVSMGSSLYGSFMLKGKIPIRNNFIIEPIYQWSNSNSGNANGTQFVVGLQYLIEYKY
jgi:prolipoprotein diacylglyceryltransferase